MGLGRAITSFAGAGIRLRPAEHDRLRVAFERGNQLRQLGTGALQFRFTDARTSERRSFADNRWAATPAQLVEPLLARELGAGAGGECKLSLRLDEFVQLFDGKGKSEVLISGSMSLRGDRVDGVYARDEFDLRQPAASADPAAGVAALRQASDALAVRIRDWLKNAPTNACKSS